MYYCRISPALIHKLVLRSIVASTGACHVPDRGSIPRGGAFLVYWVLFLINFTTPQSVEYARSLGKDIFEKTFYSSGEYA